MSVRYYINNKNKEVCYRDFKILEGYGKKRTPLYLKTSLLQGSYTITIDIRPINPSDTSVIAVTKGFTVVL